MRPRARIWVVWLVAFTGLGCGRKSTVEVTPEPAAKIEIRVVGDGSYPKVDPQLRPQTKGAASYVLQLVWDMPDAEARANLPVILMYELRDGEVSESGHLPATWENVEKFSRYFNLDWGHEYVFEIRAWTPSRSRASSPLLRSFRINLKDSP